MKKLLFMLIWLGIGTACAMGSKYKPIPHRTDLKKSLNKCTPWHVRMNGKDFDYKRSFCFAYQIKDKKGKIKKDKNGDPLIGIKHFDVLDDHDFFVNRGTWQYSK